MHGRRHVIPHWYRPLPTWSLWVAFKCAPVALCAAISPRSTPCTGAPTRGKLTTPLWRLCDMLISAICLTQQILGLCVSGRQADSVGRVHDKQSARHSAALQLGDDLRLRPLGLLCRLRRSRQHMLHLQPEDARGQCPRQPWTAWPHWLSLMLSLPRRQPNCHQLGWYDLVCSWFIYLSYLKH